MEKLNAVIIDADISENDFGELLVYFKFKLAERTVTTSTRFFVSTAGHLLNELFRAARTSCWKGILGRAVRIQFDGERVKRIGHIIHDSWVDIEALTAEGDKGNKGDK